MTNPTEHAHDRFARLRYTGAFISWIGVLLIAWIVVDREIGGRGLHLLTEGLFLKLAGGAFACVVGLITQLVASVRTACSAVDHADDDPSLFCSSAPIVMAIAVLALFSG